MNPKAVIAVLVIIVICAIAYGCWKARHRERDWREEWCCPECMAAHDQKGPCGDCPARRAAHRAAQWQQTTNYPTKRFAALPRRDTGRRKGF